MAWIHPPALGCRFSFLHLPSGRCGHSAVVSGSSLYIFGGFEGKKWLNDLHKFDTTSFVWSQPRTFGSSPQPRQYHTAVTVRENMYIFGGYNGSGWLKDLTVLDLRSLKWSHPNTFGDLPTGREGHTMVYYESYLYIYGGWDGCTIGDLYRIHLQTLIWEKVEVFGERPLLCGHSASVIDRQLFIFGGFNGNIWVNTLYRIDFSDFTCEKAKTKGEPMARGYHSATLVNRYLLVYAGYNGKYILGDLLALDIENMVWSLPDPCIGHFPSARNAHTISVIGSELFLFGGYNGTRDTNDLHILETSAFSTLQDDLKFGFSFTEGKQFSITSLFNTHSIHSCIAKVRCPKLFEISSVKLSSPSMKTLIEYLYFDKSAENIPQSQKSELSEVSIQLGLNRLRSLCDDETDVPESTLTIDIMKIMSLPEESDFVVLVENKEFRLHKVILAARCPYFRSMFDSGLNENSKNRVEFRDFRLSSFEFVIEWIYSDKFSPLFGDVQLGTEDFIGILVQSNMLGLDSLMRMAELATESVISIENVVQLFEAAHYLEALRLKSYTVNFILRDLENIQIKKQLSLVSDSAFEEINLYLPRKLKRNIAKNEYNSALNLIKLDKKLNIKPRDPKCSRLPSREQGGVISFRNPVSTIQPLKANRFSSPLLKQSVRRPQRAYTIQCNDKPESVDLMVQGISPRGLNAIERSPVLRNIGMAISSSVNSLRSGELLSPRFLQYK